MNEVLFAAAGTKKSAAGRTQSGLLSSAFESTRLLSCGYRGFVIGLITNAAHVFGMFDFAVRPDNEHGAGKNTIKRSSGNQHTIVLTE
jgi:hypothetical protein